MDSFGRAPAPALTVSDDGSPAAPGPAPVAVPVDLADPRLLLNRELSWLAFNERVLAEARDRSSPVYERLKFLAIVTSNLDEFFMVRVAGLKEQVRTGVLERSDDGLLAAELLALVAERTHAMVEEQYRVFRDEVRPALALNGVQLVRPSDLSGDQRTAAREYFLAHVFSALTPLAIDPGHPFPHLRNKSLNLAMLVYRQDKRRKRPSKEGLLAVVQVPAMLPRLVKLPSPAGQAYVLLEDLIAAHATELFPGYAVRPQEAAAFRVIRNWDFEIDEEESEDLRSTIQAELRRQDKGAAVGLALGANASEELAGRLREALALVPGDVYRIDGPLQLPDLLGLAEADPRPELRVSPWVPVVPGHLRDAESLFSEVSRRDLLLHHPYDSFDPVVRFIEEAADDPNVVAIKLTLYRTSGDSPFVRALSRAAENGKQATAFVELKARFDEANNIAWARRLEENGVHVVYSVHGYPGHKTHCKMALVVRREGSGIRRYVHIGTGNYNPSTARFYTDVSLFTAREEIADDVTALFNLLTGYSEPPSFKRLSAAPFGLQDTVISLIDREAQRARAGERGRIVAKMNALVDPKVIQALYAASNAGVQIDLVVRGICCLRPGVPGVSERIRVTSIVDRFLEHSRIFAFGTGERLEVFVASADWMPRNFVRRVEILCPIEERALKDRLVDGVLAVTLADNVKARRLQADGRYVSVEPGEATPVRSQVAMMELARRGDASGPELRSVAAA
jgi:polyphosphate kinase